MKIEYIINDEQKQGIDYLLNEVRREDVLMIAEFIKQDLINAWQKETGEKWSNTFTPIENKLDKV